MDTLLFNPGAGAIARMGVTGEQLLAKLQARGVSVRLRRCETEAEMVHTMAEVEGTVIVAGGDSTVHPLLKAAGGCGKLKLAIIPGGSAKNLATALAIPGDIDPAVEVIAAGYTELIDLAKVNGVIFSQAAGAGLHARIFHAYGERRRKSAVDAASAALATLVEWEPELMRVVIDGQPCFGELTQVTAANTGTYGGEILIAPGARVDDGLLDVVVVGKLSKSEIIEYMSAALDGRLADLPQTYATRARRIEITSAGDESVEIHADAEPAGHTPAVMEVLPGCVEVVVPKGPA